MFTEGLMKEETLLPYLPYSYKIPLTFINFDNIRGNEKIRQNQTTLISLLRLYLEK